MSVPVRLLDHRGAPLPTMREQARQQAREQERSAMARLRARFDAVQTTNENTRYWANADYLGPNSELDPGTRRTLRSRSRYECANNSYASGMIRTLANDTIGTGPDLQIVDDEIPSEVATEIEERFREWCMVVRLTQKLRLMRQAKARDGETFAQIFVNGRQRYPVRVDFNVFEADMVATTIFDTSLLNLLDGLYVDDFGNVTAYNVLREHPGENFQTMVLKADIIPADQIIHLFNSDRPGQYRGVPEITPALPVFSQLRKYTLAVLRAAESAAIPSWLLETQQPPSDMELGAAWDVLDTERGMGMTLPAGYKMSQLKAEQPTDTYQAFKREVLAEIARCLNMPYNIAAGDSSSYNYSSGRLDHRTYFKSLKVERAYIEQAALEVLAANWYAEAIRARNYLPDGSPDELPTHCWTWDGEEYIDPLKESKADQTDLESGATTLAAIYARKGMDWEAALRQRARELELCRELGVPVPGQTGAPGQPGQPGAPAPRDLEDAVRNVQEETAAAAAVVQAHGKGWPAIEKFLGMFFPWAFHNG